jgi:hypothetical protein
MDTITVNESGDSVQVIDNEDGLPVQITEEKISVSEFADALMVDTQDDHVVLRDSTETIEISDGVENVPVQFSEVFIQNKEVVAEIEVPYNTQVDFVGETVIYKGWANPGTATSTGFWRIQRLTFVGTDEDLTVEWANGNGNFTNVWDDRAGLSYS